MFNFEFSAANLFGGILFSGIGVGAFIYGKKQTSLTKMIIGGLLLIYPMMVTSTTAIYAIGTALTISLFAFKD